MRAKTNNKGMVELCGLNMIWNGHDSFRIEDEKIIYVDPYELGSENKPKADIIFITHDHFDHFSLDDIRKVATEKTLLVCPWGGENQRRGHGNRTIERFHRGALIFRKVF